MKSEPEKVRLSVLAGKWYPSTYESLKKTVDNYIQTAGRDEITNKKLFALISPHAGYVYSGLAAAYGYNELKNQDFRRIIILAPSHYHSFKGISIPDVTHYETPLGKVPVDRPVVKELLKHPLFSSIAEAHNREHSLEIQLPLLQRVLKNFDIVPLILGQIEKDEYEVIANLIKPYIDDHTLIIASSDFTHYGAQYNYIPFRNENTKSALKELDTGALNYITAKDFNGFLEYKEKTGITICGYRPIAVLLKLLPENSVSGLRHYYTSGDLTGDYTNSVSYVSMAFYKGNGHVEPDLTGKPIDAGFIDEKEQKILLDISRKTLESYVIYKKASNITTEDYNLTPRLMSERGVFITLNMNHKLRGCIGSIVGSGPLFRSAISNTLNAGFFDRRFKQVKPEELEAIHIEISVLTPPVQIKGPEEFIVGKHGIIIKKNNKQAVFLPQVAPEQGWTREETLTQLSLKAGMQPDDWRDQETDFFVFEAQVFNEE